MTKTYLRFTCKVCGVGIEYGSQKGGNRKYKICTICLDKIHNEITEKYLSLRSNDNREYEALNKLADEYSYDMEYIKSLISRTKRKWRHENVDRPQV